MSNQPDLPSTKSPAQRNNCVPVQMETIIAVIDHISAISERSAANSQNVAAAAEEQNASMQEISAAATMLATMAEVMNNAVRVFKLS